MANIDRREGFLSMPATDLKYTFVTPDLTNARPYPGVLLLHGASSAGGRGRALFNAFQRDLAKAGFASFAYDTRGVGDSTGNFYDATLSNRLVEALLVRNFCTTMPNLIDKERFAVLGVSMGGHVAARLAGMKADSVAGLILVNAAAFGSVAECKRLKPFTEFTEAIQVDRNWVDSLALRDLAKFRGPVMTISSELDAVIPQDVRESYKKAISTHARHLTLPGVPHTVMSGQDQASACAREMMTIETIEFLREVI